MIRNKIINLEKKKTMVYNVSTFKRKRTKNILYQIKERLSYVECGSLRLCQIKVLQSSNKMTIFVIFFFLRFD